MKETMDISIEGFRLALQTAMDEARADERNQIAKSLERLIEYPCLRPNWLQIASDIREGQYK